MDDDPRARHLLESVGDAVSKLLPDTIDIETASSVAGANGGAILRRPGDSINQHWYTRVVPDGTTSPERIST